MNQDSAPPKIALTPLSTRVVPRVLVLHIEVQSQGQLVLQKTFQSFPVIFGRGEQCHVSLAAFSFVSRNHGNITIERSAEKAGGRDRVVVKDLGSVHGLNAVAGGPKLTQLDLGSAGRFWVGTLMFNLRLEALERTEPATAIHIPPEAGARPVLPTHSPVVGSGSGPRRSISTGQISARSSEVPAATSSQGTGDVVYRNLYRDIFNGELSRFDFKMDEELQTLSSSAGAAKMSMQAAISWGDELFDIRNFLPGDRFTINPRLYQEISLPALKKKINLGRLSDTGGEFQIPPNMGWDLSRDGELLSPENLGATLNAENRLRRDKKNKIHLSLRKNEVLTLHFTPEIKAHFRYICRPRPDFPRSWIENKEEFKKAAQISFAVHIVICLVCLFSAPKVESPAIENVPPRFARLLMEPPKPVVVIPPPPVPTPEPTPTPTPVVVQKPPEVKPPLPKPKPKAPPKVVKKETPRPLAVKAPPRAAQKEIPAAAKGPVSEKPVQQEPSPAEREAAALADMLNSAPSPGAQGKPSDLKIRKTGGSAAAGIKVGGLAGAVPSNGPPVASGFGKNPSALAGAGQGGLAQTSGSKAGKRAVKAILAEPTKVPNSEQGLTQDELNAVIAKYVGQIQRCYERALFDVPTLVGRIEYEWTISPQGGVGESHVKRSEMAGADSLNQCVLKVIGGMKFPRAKNALPTVASVGFPFGK